MTHGEEHGDSFSAWEALLLCCGLSALIATLCIGLYYWIEGPHYAFLFVSPWDVVRVWIIYLLSFVVPGMAGWGLARALGGPNGGRSARLVVIAACSLPPILGLAATRPMLLGGIVPHATVAGLVASIPALVHANRSQRPVVRRVIPSLLIALPPALTAFNLLTWLRPSDFRGASRLVVAVGICLLAGLVLATIHFLVWTPKSALRVRRLSCASALAPVAMFATIGAPWLTLWNSPGSARGLERKRQPSVLLVVVDTLRADVVSGFGAVPDATPAIQALARDAVIFTRAMSAAPWTTPSFASILSSTYPSEHRAGSRDLDLGFRQALVDRVPTLPVALRDHGFWTGSVLTNAYLGRRFGLDRGFTAYENILAIEWAHPLLVGLARIGCLEIPPFVRAPRQTERVLGLIRRAAASGRPFLVLAHFMDPHLPYRQGGDERRGVKAESKPYRDEVALLDRGIERLVSELKRDGLYDDMLIVLTADHGEELEEGRGYGQFGHGHTMFDEILHVPLIVKLPGAERAGERRDEVVSLIDVAPTILDRVGAPIPTGFRGQSLIADSREPRPIFAERTLYGPERKAAIFGNLKVVLDYDDSGPQAVRAFDLAADPGEKSPLDPEHPSFRGLAGELEAFAESDVEGADSADVELDARFLQRLEALGYGE